jgi:hypothetical protein
MKTRQSELVMTFVQKSGTRNAVFPDIQNRKQVNTLVLSESQ